MSYLMIGASIKDVINWFLIYLFPPKYKIFYSYQYEQKITVISIITDFGFISQDVVNIIKW